MTATEWMQLGFIVLAFSTWLDLWDRYREIEQRLGIIDDTLKRIERQVDEKAVPFWWLDQQADSPWRTDQFRKACDMVMLEWQEKINEEKE